MEESLTSEQPAIRAGEACLSTSLSTESASVSTSVLPAQGSCPTCAAAQSAAGVAPPVPRWVHAIGHIELRFPLLSVEKEVAQAKGRTDTAGLTDQQALVKVLRENPYLMRQMCAVLLVQGVETYILMPRNPVDYILLLEAVRSSPAPTDLDVVIGLLGPVASPNVCNGLQLPIVIFDQIYSFDRASFLQAIPRPDNVEADRFTAAAGEVFDLILRQADNAGATDEHRATNYLAVRYPEIYTRTASAFAASSSLASVIVKPSPLTGVRNIVDVVFTYTNRASGVDDKWFVRVDVTEEFPFLVTKLSPYYDR